MAKNDSANAAMPLSPAVMAKLDPEVMARIVRVQAVIAIGLKARRQEARALAKMNADLKSQVDVVLAPDVRRIRGDVVAVDRLRTDDRGRTRGRIQADIVQSKLQRMFRCGEISRRQALAGDALAADFERLEIPIKSLLNVEISGGGGDGTDQAFAMRCDAGRRIARALSGLSRELAEVVIWVSVMGSSAIDWAIARGYKRTSAGDILRMGLTHLADHYGLDSR